MKDAEAYLEPCQTSKMAFFVKAKIGFQPLSVFAKSQILDVWEGFECTSAKYLRSVFKNRRGVS